MEIIGFMRLIILPVLALMTACANQPSAPQEDIRQGRQSGVQVDSQSTVAKNPAAAVAEQRPAQPPQQPVPIRSRANVAQMPVAAQNLLRSAQKAYKSGDYAAAIASAERGLRISRTSAELLMVLARSYEARQDFDQARVFAQRGRRYSTQGKARDSFDELLNRLAN